MAKDSLSEPEACTLLWEEWRYRHELFWQALYRWGLAAVAVSIAPWIKPDLVNDLRYFVLFFPALASLLALFAAWHIAAEYSRLIKVDARYRALSGKYAPESISGPLFPIGWLWRIPIGWAVPISFALFAVPVSFINAALLIARILQQPSYT